MAPPGDEREARGEIDRLLTAAGWLVFDASRANLSASRGVAIREFPLPGHGFADYLLYLDGKAAGVIEAKRQGVTLSGAAFAGPPALHRWVSVSANRVVAAAARVISRYQGDAGLIWGDKPSAEELRERLELFEGIGQKKSAMAVEILERGLKVPLRKLEGSDVAVDVHVRRVFLRSGLAERDDKNHIIAVARRFNPERPGALDQPAWEIGRIWCRPNAPDCGGCPIGAVCPRLIDRAADVRGA